MSSPTRDRPALFRALGSEGPPPEVTVAGRPYRLVDVFKHDSWAATGRYQGAGGDVVCKFNRTEPILGMPMRWLGRRVAAREAFALRRLAGVPGVPQECGPVAVDGRACDTACAHVYIPGHPLRHKEPVGEGFFPALRSLLGEIHRRGIAYVDLHKRENVVVGEDGKPYLVDFQVCFGLWFPRSAANPLLRRALRALQRADLYHLAKHVRRSRPDQLSLIAGEAKRPGWIDVHRRHAAPLRGLRRRFLTTIGVRGEGGKACTETFAEDAFRHEGRRAA